MNDEMKQQFLDFGALGYTDAKMMSILQVEQGELVELKKQGGEQAYQSGRDQFDFAVDRKLMQMAAGGDLKALQKIELRRRK